MVLCISGDVHLPLYFYYCCTFNYYYCRCIIRLLLLLCVYYYCSPTWYFYCCWDVAHLLLLLRLSIYCLTPAAKVILLYEDHRAQSLNECYAYTSYHTSSHRAST